MPRRTNFHLWLAFAESFAQAVKEANLLFSSDIVRNDSVIAVEMVEQESSRITCGEFVSGEGYELEFSDWTLLGSFGMLFVVIVDTQSVKSLYLNNYRSS